MTTRNYLRDILYGICVGDALGVPVEFESREYLKKKPVSKMCYGGIHEQMKGTWSDDSSLTFCLAESIIEGYDIQLLASKFVEWKNDAYWTARGKVFDIGNTTKDSIINLSNGMHPTLSGGSSKMDNGNGSLMRILPLVLLLKDSIIQKRFELVKEVSSITHSHNRSVIACFYYLEFALLIMEGKDKFEIYENLKITISEFLNQAEIYSDEINHFDRLLKENIYELEEDAIQSGGYVLDTLEASIWCLLNSDNYEAAVLKAVNLGGDTDTTGAVTGGLAGLLFGFESIPKNWFYTIAKINEINQLIHSYQKQANSLRGIMTLNYTTTTFGDSDEERTSTEDSALLYDSVPHELDVNLHLTNTEGLNTISLNFNYPNYPYKGLIENELESFIIASYNDIFVFGFSIYEIIYINENVTILKGTLGVSAYNSSDLDCFQYELLVQHPNCQEIIKNSTICVVQNGDIDCEY